jgi:hypothetical protein
VGHACHALGPQARRPRRWVSDAQVVDVSRGAQSGGGMLNWHIVSDGAGGVRERVDALACTWESEGGTAQVEGRDGGARVSRARRRLCDPPAPLASTQKGEALGSWGMTPRWLAMSPASSTNFVYRGAHECHDVFWGVAGSLEEV